MEKKNEKGKTYVFIDASNIIYGVIKYDGWKVDLEKLMKYLKNRYSAEKVYYYGGLEKDNKKQASFYKKLEKDFGYTPRIKEVLVYNQPDGSKVRKANCDVDMTFDMMRLLGQYSRAIVLTGDGDFACVIEYLMKKKRQVKIIANAKRTSKKLKDLVGSNFIDIRSLKSLVEIKKGLG